MSPQKGGNLSLKEGGVSLEKAMSLWLNSTLGIIGAISVAAPNILARPNFSLDAIRRIPVPDLDESQTNGLARAFDKNCDKVLLSLTEIDKDEIRENLDKAVSDTLGVSEDELMRVFALKLGPG